MCVLSLNYPVRIVVLSGISCLGDRSKSSQSNKVTIEDTIYFTSICNCWWPVSILYIFEVISDKQEKELATLEEAEVGRRHTKSLINVT